ncbi:MAG: hypothetical protein Q8Q88_15890 [Phenylobacterium sp.]|uniref:hypothetical protein n=1 Tax=Phenylobacterium sp. TaxID=1871053 RepID=UPI002737321B|nr:hypothetical protein [Phenylobacterium sp.]MDP3748521.1 hypothetical protein [Phenylobacterium sp.]
MQSDKRIFAFRLAEKKRNDARPKDGKWRARDGLSIAGCTDETGDGDYREAWTWPTSPPGYYVGPDRGYWC